MLQEKGRVNMKFTTADEVKKWLRGLPLAKRELKLKMDFYKDLIRDNLTMGKGSEKYIAFYRQKIEDLQEELIRKTGEMERVLDRLDPEERMVLTARYVKGVLWDAMEFHVHYSRRQAVRIHNQAVENLVGIELGGMEYGKEEIVQRSAVPCCRQAG